MVNCICDPLGYPFSSIERPNGEADRRKTGQQPDPIKRGLNPYPYFDNDPVNYVDPTGEIPGILAGGFSCGIIGGAAGFVVSAVSQAAGGGNVVERLGSSVDRRKPEKHIR